MEGSEIGLPDHPEGPLEIISHKLKPRNYPCGLGVKNLPVGEGDKLRSLVPELGSHMPQDK